MLVSCTNKKGETLWLNPFFIRCVKQAKGGTTEVYFHVDPARTSERFIKVREPAETIAGQISDALPLLFGGVGSGPDTFSAMIGVDASSGDGTDGYADGGDGGAGGGGSD